MRDRESHLGEARTRPGAKKRRLRSELERRGLARELSQPIAARLAPLLETAPTRAWDAALDAAAATVEVVRDGAASEPDRAASEPDRAASAPDRAADVAEIQRLMLGFTDELRKLEEGLRILSAFVVRMRTRAGFDTDGVLH